MARLLLISWLGCFGGPCHLFCQNDLTENGCVDIVRMKNGDIFRGQMIEYQPDKLIVLKTVTGLTLHLPGANVKKIVQDCPKQKRGKKSGADRSPRVYDFREKGFYNALRLGSLTGQTFWGENTSGYFAQYSGGWQFNRFAGLGLGIGAENFTPNDGDVATYPVFAEFRAYVLPKNISPYLSIAGGRGFAGKIRDVETDDFQWQTTTNWDGGWMAAGRLGLRIGNHFTFDFGARFQRKYRNWTSTRNPGETGRDKILNKRLEIAIGLIF